MRIKSAIMVKRKNKKAKRQNKKAKAARRKKTKKLRRLQRSPVKMPRRPTSFGKVKTPGQKTIANMEMRSVLKFMRKKHPDWGKLRIARETGYSLSFVKRRWDSQSIEDALRKGGPRTVRTPSVMKALANSRDKLKNNSNRINATNFTKKFNSIHYSSVSRAFKELGLPYFRRPTVGKLNAKHIKDRFAWARQWRHMPTSFWEKFFVTDEQIFVNGSKTA